MSGWGAIAAIVRAAPLAGAIALTGCSEYLDRRETISFGAGNAQQANLVVHALTPSPSRAADRDLRFGGERMANALVRYRRGDVAGRGAETGAVVAQSAAADSIGQ